MQVRHDQRVPFGTAIRYRTIGGRWHAGEAVEIRDSELMFLCNVPLEMRTELEIILPAKVQVIGSEAALSLLCAGRVVRRFLANWPDLRSALVVSISGCRILSEADTGDAHAA